MCVWLMATLKFTIKGNPVTKKNSQRIVNSGGRYRVIQSERYLAYEELALWQLPKVHINYPVNVKCVYFRDSKRRVDLTNLLEATDDILVKGGVLEDDNCNILVSHDGSIVKYDKQNPRVEVEITERTDI